MAKARKLLMTDSFDIKGFWFLEKEQLDNDSECVSGILRYTPQKIILELIGYFGDAKSFFIGEMAHEERIFGFSDEGEWITLFGCYPFQMRSSSPGFETVNYSVSKMYVGNLVDSENDSPRSISFSFTNLDAWIRKSVYKQRAFGMRGHSLTVDLDSIEPELLKIEVAESNFRISEEVAYSVSMPKEYVICETHSITVSSFYRIEPIEKGITSLDSFFKILHSLRRVLVMLIGKPMYFKYIDYDFETEKNDGDPRRTRCRLFFTQIGDCSDVRSINPSKPNAVLIKHQDIKEILEGVVHRWFLEQHAFDETTQAYINSKYLHEYLYTEFLNCARGLEAYHRFFVENNNNSPEYLNESEGDSSFLEDCKKISDFIKHEIKEEYKDLFLRRTSFKEQLTFGKRIRYLIDALPNRLSAQLFGGMDSNVVDELVRCIVHTRNYYTHRDDIKKHKHAIIEPTDLYKLMRKLEIVLQYYSLVELGIDKNMVDLALSESINCET